MKSLILLLAVCGPLWAISCPAGFIEIASSGVVNPDGSLFSGTMTLDPGVNGSVSGSPVRRNRVVATVTGGVMDFCLAPGNYTDTNRITGSTLTYITYWNIPSTGGPYSPISIPGGTVNVSTLAVIWVSGLTFAGVAPGDSTLINNAPCIVASIQSPTALTLQAPGCGSQSGVSFSDGPVERLTPPVPFPPTIAGPPGPQGLPGLGPALPVVTGTYCLVVGAGPAYAWTNCSGSLSYTTWTSLGSITWTSLNGTWSSLFH